MGASIYLGKVLSAGTKGCNIIVPTTSIDPDAQAFITAASITDATQQTAINNLVTGLKTDGIWSKMKALYPFVGGTASAHKFNLKDPRDLDAAFRLVFSGGFTHNSNGVTGNGVNTFANTWIIPSVSLTNNSLSVTAYSRTNVAENSSDLGVSNSGFLPIIGLGLRGTLNTIIFDAYDFSAHRLTPSNTDSRGFFHGNVLNSTNQKVYKNGIEQASTTTAQTQTQPNTHRITLFARNDNGSPTNYSTRNLAFSSIGDGLTDTEAANLYTRVNNFQVALSRNV